MSRSLKKEALLSTAESLFYKHGFHAIGVKKILAEANVANMTMYNHFSSKEHLIEEVLRKRETAYWKYLKSFQHKKSDENPFLQLIEAHSNWLKENGDKGCLFLRAIQEYNGKNSNIEAIAKEHKAKLIEYLKEIAIENNYPEDSAYQISIILEGSTSITEYLGPEEAMKHANNVARSLFGNEQ